MLKAINFTGYRRKRRTLLLTPLNDQKIVGRYFCTVVLFSCISITICLLYRENETCKTASNELFNLLS